MTSDDLATVQRSWTLLRPRRAALLDALTRRFEVLGPPSFDPATRARWLLDVVEELVELLTTPSVLASRASALGATWPDPHTAPSFGAEGRAWLDAAEVCQPGWSKETALAWKQAWLLLSDVLAAEALSPFADDPLPRPRPVDGPRRHGHPPTEVSPTPPTRGTLP